MNDAVSPTLAPEPPASEEQELATRRQIRRHRVLVTTAVFAALWAALVLLVHVEGFGLLTPLILLVPIYLLALPFVLRTPKRFRKAKPRLLDRVGWHARLMISVVFFLALYLPFAFFTDPLIPYAPLVEYVLFALLLFVLLRLAGRAVGVAPSLDALPPPTHRLHQQVVTPLDDAHYQQTLWLHYNFVEKGRGTRSLSRRIEELLEHNGVDAARRGAVLSELATYRSHGGLWWGRGSDERHRTDRDRRAQLLSRLLDRVHQELEQPA